MKRSTIFKYYGIALGFTLGYWYLLEVFSYSTWRDKRFFAWILTFETLLLITAIAIHGIVSLSHKHDKRTDPTPDKKPLKVLTFRQRLIVNIKVAWRDNRWNFVMPFVMPLTFDLLFFASCYKNRQMYVDYPNATALVFVSAFLGFVFECFFPRRRTTSQRIEEATLITQQESSMQIKGGLTLPSQTSGELTQVHETGQISAIQRSDTHEENANSTTHDETSQ